MVKVQVCETQTKSDDLKLKGAKIGIQMTTMMLKCMYVAFFERATISNFWDSLYFKRRRT